MKKPATYRSKLSSRSASLARTHRRRHVEARATARWLAEWRSRFALFILHSAFCTVAHSARRKTKHHLNSASSGNTPKKTNFVWVLSNFTLETASPSFWVAWNGPRRGSGPYRIRAFRRSGRRDRSEFLSAVGAEAGSRPSGEVKSSICPSHQPSNRFVLAFPVPLCAP